MALSSELLELHIHDGHNSSILISDAKTGKILFGANEERYTRAKNQGGFPINSIKASQNFLNYKPEQIKSIFFSTKSIPYIITDKHSNIFRKLFIFFGPFIPKRFFSSKLITNFYLISSSFIRRRKAIKNLKNLGFNYRNIYFYDHHYCHCASTMGFSSQENKGKVLVFTLDASGDAKSGSISIYESNSFKAIQKIHTVDSLGEIYSQVTGLLQMKPMEHEYKLMGLAPYCKKEFAEKVYKTLEEKIISLEYRNDGFLEIKSKKGLWGKELYKQLEKELKGYRFDAIAAGVQLLIEEIVTKWIKSWIKRTNIRNIALAGGVFMNVKLNKKIAELEEVSSLTIVPSCGDESLVFGSWFISNLNKNKNKPLNLNHIYNQASKTGLLIGNSYSQEEVKKEIRKYLKSFSNPKKLTILEGEEINNIATDLLIKGKIGARFVGKMEFGARSLGNRSIICSPAKIEQIRVINEAIKSRDFWMPFAPVVLEKDAGKYFKIRNANIGCYELMQTAVNANKLAVNKAPATLHPYDRTARPQVLRKEVNPSFYELINNFREKTGLPILLNTSFNFHGYPVVESPRDALEVFFESGIDFLIIEKNLIAKEEIKTVLE